MADLTLKGNLNLMGNLTLNPDGGKVLVDGAEVLVEDGAEGTAASPVILPPPPATPIDTGVAVQVISSFNKTIKAGSKNIVALGIVMQGDNPTWPGMMLPGASTVLANGTPINVVGDQATIFPSGGVGTFSTSGQ